MKKEYSKPQIMFEDFSISTNIAADCDFQNGLLTQGVCGYETRQGIVFVSGVAGCKYIKPDNDDSLCYHVPTVNTNIFNS